MIKTGDKVIAITTADNKVCAVPVSFATKTGERCIIGQTADGKNVPIKCTPMSTSADRGILVKTADGVLTPVKLGQSIDFWAYGTGLMSSGLNDLDGFAYYDGSQYLGQVPNFVVSYTPVFFYRVGVQKVKTDSAGNLYIVGLFDDINGDSTFGNVAMWNGTNWDNLSGGVDNGTSGLMAIAIDEYDNIYVGGRTCNKVHKWNGSTWSELPFTLLESRNNYHVRDMFCHNGLLHVCGTMNGLDTPAGNISTVNQVFTYNLSTGAIDDLSEGMYTISGSGAQRILFDNNNNLVTTGLFNHDRTICQIGIYNGSSWDTVTISSSYPFTAWDIAIDSTNNYYTVHNEQYIKKWDGTSLSTISLAGYTKSIGILPDGRMITGGSSIIYEIKNDTATQIALLHGLQNSSVEGFLMPL